MKRGNDRNEWLEQALEDETDIPKPVRRHVKVRNSDKLEVSPDKMTKKWRENLRWAGSCC